MKFSEWFEDRLSELDLKPAHVAKKSGGVIKPNTISGWQKGTSRPSFDNLPVLAKILECTADDIVNLRKVKQSEPPSNDIMYLPYFETVEFASGNGRLFYDESAPRMLAVPKRELRDSGADPKHVVFVKNVGQSNLGKIPENVPVPLDMSKKDIRDGHAYGVRHGELFRIKFLSKMPDGSVKLKSYNPEYEDEIVTKQQIEDGFFEVYGWVCFWKTKQNWA